MGNGEISWLAVAALLALIAARILWVKQRELKDQSDANSIGTCSAEARRFDAISPFDGRNRNLYAADSPNMEHRNQTAWARRGAIAAIVYTFTAFLIFALGIHQSIQTDEANRISRESLIDVQRAFIVVGIPVRIRLPSSNDDGLLKDAWSQSLTADDNFIAIKNSGNTPTKNLRIVIVGPGVAENLINCQIKSDIPRLEGQSEVLNAKSLFSAAYFIASPEARIYRDNKIGAPADPEAIFRNPGIASAFCGQKSNVLDGPWETRFVLGPKDQIGPRIWEIISPSIHFDAMRGNHTPSLVYGIAEYNDVFPDSQVHRTKFCFNLIGRIVQRGTDSSSVPQACKFWNCADEECEEDARRYAAAASQYSLEQAAADYGVEYEAEAKMREKSISPHQKIH